MTALNASLSMERVLKPVIGADCVWLRVGNVIDGDGRPVLSDAHLLYDAHAIRHVGPAAEEPPPEFVGIRVQPDAWLPDITVLPGLIEAHAHLFLDGTPLDFAERKKYLLQSPEWMLNRARTRWTKLLRTGVTAVRDAGDRAGAGLTLQDEYRTRNPAELKPYIDSPGPAIHHRGRYGSFMSDPLEDHPSPEQCVAARVHAGAERIKIIATGIINFDAGAVTTPPQIPADELCRLVAAANSMGRSTFAHASGTEGIENCIQARVGSIEHGFFVTNDQLARMRDLAIAWVPTFAPVQIQIDQAAVLGWSPAIVAGLQRIIDRHIDSLNHAQQIGVTIVAGSDAGSCGVPHGLGFLTELELMQNAGMSPASVIAAATGISARAIGFAEPFGRIAPGFRPRMLLTRHDPLLNVRNLRRDKWIVFDGRTLHSPGNESPEGL